MNLIDSSGQFTGTPGYARNFTPRSAPGFTDTSLVHILPPSDPLEARDLETDGISPTDPMCRKSQQEQYQSNGFPRLSAQPGSMIALRYEENGHVTLPQNQKGKPPNRGTVYVYGTNQPKPTENFLDVFKQWDAAGTGGDKRGKLLATQNFDDGRCYQVNSGAISQARQSQYPHSPDTVMGQDLWCQTDIKIPDDVPAGKPYTIYWTWSWPTLSNIDLAVPKGKAEIYTTCMDIDVKSASKERSLEARAAQEQNLNSMAIPSIVSSMANPSAAAPASSQAPQSNAAAAPASSNAAAASQPASGPASAVAPVAAAVQQPNQIAAQPSQAAPTSSMPVNAPSGLASAESIVLSVLGSQVISEIAAQVHTQAPVTVTVTAQQASGGCPSAAANVPAAPPAASSAAANPAAANTAAAVPTAANTAAAVPAAANTASANPAAPDSAAQGPAAQPPATTTVTSGTSTIFQPATQTATSTLSLSPTVANSEEPSAMPSSLQMTSPLMGPTSAAEAPAASESPVASSASGTPASPEASQPSPALPTLSGTATPVASPAANTAGSSPSASSNTSTGSSGTTAAKRCDAGTCRKAKKSHIFS